MHLFHLTFIITLYLNYTKFTRKTQTNVRHLCHCYLFLTHIILPLNKLLKAFM
nr:MAG TPA: hypothetical protein [Bacteriophage sp.]